MTTAAPCPEKTIDPRLVEMFLSTRANQFVTIEFFTVKGEHREYNGQLRATSRLVGSARGKRQGAQMKDRGQVWLALPDGKSKSFYLDRVKRIKGGGAELRAA